MLNSHLTCPRRPHQVEHFHDVAELSVKDLAQLLYKHKLDVLVNLNGYTKVGQARCCHVMMVVAAANPSAPQHQPRVLATKYSRFSQHRYSACFLAFQPQVAHSTCR